MHLSVDIQKKDTRIPETVRVYNSTKFGVDVTDQKARKYSVKSKSQRWPLQVFSNILDLAGITSWILYKEATDEEISRQEFLFQLAEELGTEYQKEKQISQECSSKTIINTNTVSSERRSCQIGYCKVNKTNKICCNYDQINVWYAFLENKNTLIKNLNLLPLELVVDRMERVMIPGNNNFCKDTNAIVLNDSSYK
uniref:PiggyBac transposable element-derived protein domain-containing protein n=1 Tax=Glossina palpalis gambiensis TaxID=67801 RepID=A0A1B0BR31_9MUSC